MELLASPESMSYTICEDLFITLSYYSKLNIIIKYKKCSLFSKHKSVKSWKLR